MDDEELASFGPAMRSLSPMRRRFVMAMAADPFGAHKDWAIKAGYSDAADGAKVRAHEVMHDPNYADAVLEVARGMLTTAGPIIAAHAMLTIAANPKHKRHLQAVDMVANRVGLHEVQHVEVKRTDETTESLMRRLTTLAEVLGVDPAKLLGANFSPAGPRLIEGEVSHETGGE